MHGSGMWRCGVWMRGAIAAVSVMLAAAPAATAAPPQSDPLNPPTVAVTAEGPWAYGLRHPADGDTLTASPGTWSGLGNTYSYQWQRCSTTAASSCVDVDGRTSSTLVPDTLFGNHLRVAVTATNAQGSATAYTALTERLADERAHRIDAAAGPVLTGVLEEGERLTIDGLQKFTGSRPVGYKSFQQPWLVWRRYDNPSKQHQLYTIVPNESDSYVLQPGDVGKYFDVTISLVNGAGHGADGDYTAIVGPVLADTDPPAATSAPSIIAAGGAVDGSLLQGAPGLWSGGGQKTYAYQWLRCDDAGASCAELPGETLSQYTPDSADVGARLRLRVTATSQYGSRQESSAPTEVVAPAPPAATANPAVAGTARDGQVLSGTPGSFSGTQPISSQFAWERCDEQGNACQNVAGATGTAYAPTPEDIGRRLRLKQVATNAGGTTFARSSATAVVQAIAPTAVEMPAISGRPRDEEAFSSTRGDWTGSPSITYARQWMRCSTAADPGGCSPIAGATGDGYTTTGADVGSLLRVRVTAANFGNSVAAFSEASAVIAAVAPHAGTAPSVSGEAVDGHTLTAAPGTWAGTVPQTYARRWERCDAQAQNCTAIAGATAGTYELVSADVARRVRVVVIASGPGGTTEASSAATDPIGAVAPWSVAAPEISGTARDGDALTATGGAWAGSTPMQRTWQWERCTGQGQRCAAITGATGSTYELAAQDVGQRVRVTVRAVNAGGETTASSNPSAVVAAVAPASTELPAVTGSARDEETLTATQGTWTGSPSIAYARQWLRCPGGGDTGGCEVIPDASSLSYELTDDDVGSFLRLRVTATNAAGSATAHSAPAGGGAVAPAGPSPLDGEGPTATIYAPGASLPDGDQSAPDVGDRLVASPGSWSGTDRPGHGIAFGYAWERCTVAGCAAVPGRTTPETTVTGDDLGAQLRAVVTATNPTGAQSQGTPRFGVTRGPASPAFPVLPAPSVASSPALPAGSLLAPSRCQRVARRTLSLRAGAAGRVRLTVPAGAASVLAPLAVKVSVARPKALRKVTLRVGGRAVRLVARRGRSGGTLAGTVEPRLLVLSPQLSLRATPRRGRPARASGRLATRDCEALLSVVLRGARLALRVDRRDPIGTASFTLPRGLALKVTGGRLGRLETLPFGDASTTTTAGQVGGNVQLAGSTVSVTGLPAQTAAVTLNATLAGRARRGRTLRFRAATTGPDGTSRALATSVSVRR